MSKNKDNEVIYFKTDGPTALSFREKELIGHGIDTHGDGFGSPIGKLKGSNLAIENMSPRDLKAYNFHEGEYIEFEFESGIKVAGTIITGTRNIKGELILIQFSECAVTYEDEFLFKPEWGAFDLAIGKEIVSAFSGPADDNSFDLITHKSSTTTIKKEYSKQELELHTLYESVKNVREGKNATFSLEAAFELIKNHHANDWLLPLEIYELVYDRDEKFATQVLEHLNDLKSKRPKIEHLITGGLDILSNSKTHA